VILRPYCSIVSRPQSGMKFQTWLQVPIEWNGQIMQRATCISKFTACLYEFVQKKRYAWGIPESRLRNCIATGLYENEGLSCLESVWSYGGTNSDSEEDKIHYDHIMNEEVWAKFWIRCGKWTDVDLNEYRGWDRRIDIQAFIWSQLNLETSYETKELEEILRGGEDEGDDFQTTRKQGYDTYLQESVEYSGWGGYRR